MNHDKLMKILLLILGILLVTSPVIIQDRISKKDRELVSDRYSLSSKRDDLKIFTEGLIDSLLPDTVKSKEYVMFYFADLNSFYNKKFRIEVNFRFYEFNIPHVEFDKIRNLLTALY